MNSLLLLLKHVKTPFTMFKICITGYAYFLHILVFCSTKIKDYKIKVCPSFMGLF